MQGRIVAAGVSIAVGAGLVGFMAAGDHHTAGASQSNSSSSSSASSSSSTSTDAGDGSGGATATPPDGRDFPTGNSGFSPQPQTRTGGS